MAEDVKCSLARRKQQAGTQHPPKQLLLVPQEGSKPLSQGHAGDTAGGKVLWSGCRRDPEEKRSGLSFPVTGCWQQSMQILQSKEE